MHTPSLVPSHPTPRRASRCNQRCEFEHGTPSPDSVQAIRLADWEAGRVRCQGRVPNAPRLTKAWVIRAEY